MAMNTTRLEAFSDAVIAIIMTIMVLELQIPHGTDLASLKPLIPVFITYVMSFVYLGIYWNNHHHMFHATDHIHGMTLWANLHLLFWLSLFPFVTGWMDENYFAPVPTALYGFVLIMAAFAYYFLEYSIIRKPDVNTMLKKALEQSKKGKISIIVYLIAIPMALQYPIIAFLLYTLVALIWFVPDKRIERLIHD
jgi:uncharacterized membrane protein